MTKFKFIRKHKIKVEDLDSMEYTVVVQYCSLVINRGRGFHGKRIEPRNTTCILTRVQRKVNRGKMAFLQMRHLVVYMFPMPL